MAAKLTSTNWTSLKLPADGPADRFVSDEMTTGLYLRLRRSADGKTSGSWVFRYRPALKEQKRKSAPITIKIGDRKVISLKDARGEAERLGAVVANGGDPRSEGQRSKVEAAKRVLGRLADAYLADMNARGIVNADSIYRTILNNCRTWMARDIVNISRSEWTGLANGVGADARQRLHRFLGFVVEDGHLDANPLTVAHGRRKSRVERLEEQKRRGQLELGGVSGRVLSNAELQAIWKVTNSRDPFHLITRFQMLTGCRRGEAAALRYEWDQGDWVLLPATVTKAGRDHRIFVTPELRSVLGPHQPGRIGLVFPSLRGPRINMHLDEVPVSGWSQLHGRLMTQSGVKSWSSHCLRKTCITRLRETGESRESVRSFVGQKVGLDRLDDSYDLRDFSQEQRRIAQLWAEMVSGAVSGEHRSPIKLVATR
ncbi:tyrosine-type recombinase/integrase [Roseibium album]|uniref:tyrosine-type recombinase/integrase n=1 Tax=Roseibium album TaxID=311410 RepID=UPI0024907E29|nr:integrase family protein [Roseibium album]